VLRVYTRHYRPCKQSDGGYRRCHCPKWINGTLPDYDRERLRRRFNNASGSDVHTHSLGIAHANTCTHANTCALANAKPSGGSLYHHSHGCERRLRYQHCAHADCEPVASI
jgi:hypothetical protein